MVSWSQCNKNLFIQWLQVLVKRWDPSVEDLTEEGVNAETVERIRESKDILHVL